MTTGCSPVGGLFLYQWFACLVDLRTFVTLDWAPTPTGVISATNTLAVAILSRIVFVMSGGPATFLVS